MAFVVLAPEEVRTWIGLRSSDATQDVLLELLEKIALSVVQRISGQVLTPQQQVVSTVDGSGQSVLYLPSPAVSVSAVRYRFATGWSDPWGWLVTDPVNDIQINGRELYFTTGAYWPQGSLNIEITYVTGYDPPNFPPDLKLVLLEIIGYKYRGRAQAIPSLSEQDEESDAWRGLSGIARAILNTYRRVSR